MYSLVSAINPVSTRKIFLPFAFCGALELFGAWLADDSLPYDFYATSCVVYTKIWWILSHMRCQLETDHSPPIDEFTSDKNNRPMEYDVFGAGNRLVLTAKLSD